MFYVIDREDLVFLPIKHKTLNVVCDLIWVEAHHRSISVYSDRAFLLDLTDYELMLLHNHTTGLDKINAVGSKLRAVLYEMALRIPEREVNSVLLAMQADKIQKDDANRYLYDHGKLAPAQQPELFELQAVKLARSENMALVCELWADRLKAPVQKPGVAASKPLPPLQNVPKPPQPVAAPAPGIIPPWLRPK